ncbi:MAG: flagellar filament capping protein FliD, partial [Terracidiphilus sp.]
MSSTSAVNSLLSNSATTTPAINISSILAASSGSSTPGIDVTSAVAAAIYADRAPERIWQADQTTLTSQTTALNAMQTATTAIETDMQSLNTLTGPLSSRTVASSNSNYVTATAADGTTLGNHTVVVNSLAATAAWYSDSESLPTTTLPTSSFTISTAGAAVTFQTGANTSGDNLNDLATAINSATTSTGASLGLTATVVTDSTGSRLAIVANSPGAASDFSVSEPYTTWTAPELPSGDTLGANNLILTSAAGTANITTTSGESYSDLATSINNATVSTAYSSAQTTLASTTPLTTGSVTTIQDSKTGGTFTYTAAAGATIGDLNTAIAAAVTAGTLSANVTGAVNGAGQEVISEGTTDQGITVSTNDSVLGAMSATTSTPLGLTATATTDSSGNQYLTITSGSSATFTINEPSATDSTFAFTQATQGANASVTIDGVPASYASNTVTGAIPGVTFTLLGATSGGTVDLTVGTDPSAVSTAVNQFVTDYNTAVGLINTQFSVTSTTNSSGASTNSQGVLATDPTVVALQSALEQAIAYTATPATGTTTTVSTLNDLGITMGDDGTLTVDQTTLNNALTNNPTDVQNF